MALRDALDKIHSDVMQGFTYKSDQEQYGLKEHWVQPEDPYNVTGDCEDFALACRDLCKQSAIASRLVYCKTETGEGHCVLECHGYIVDNRQKRVYIADDVNYEWNAMSGYEAGDPWTGIKG